jgi:uncharacterized membrane protein
MCKSSQLEQAANAQRSTPDRMADAISRFVGSMGFVYIHVVWFGVWIVLGTLPFIRPIGKSTRFRSHS